jgi:hypothetical protein
VIAWGACASWGCVQAAKPNPTQAVPIHKVITDKPIIKVPGCPPIAEVMTGVVTYMLTFDRSPSWTARAGRRCSTASASTTSATAGRTSTPASSSSLGRRNARKGYCLYKVGCKGPTTYNACSTVRWNEGVSSRSAGHGCIGCSEDGFWDKGSFYDRLTTSTSSASKPTPTRSAARRPAWWARRWRRMRRKPNQGGHHTMGAYETQGFKLDNTAGASSSTRSPASKGHMRCEVNLDKTTSSATPCQHRHHVARAGSHPEGPRPARRLGLCRAHLRRVHRHPRADQRARGGRRAGHQDPEKRPPAPRT